MGQFGRFRRVNKSIMRRYRLIAISAVPRASPRSSISWLPVRHMSADNQQFGRRKLIMTSVSNFNFEYTRSSLESRRFCLPSSYIQIT